MSRTTRIKAAALLVAAAALLSVSGPSPSPGITEASAPEPTVAPPAAPQPLNQCNFYSEEALRLHAQAPAYKADGLEIAIVPHYAPAMDLLAGVLAACAGSGFSRVIILGPDHEAQGSGISLSGRGWDTPSGILEGDSDAARTILANADIRAVENHELLQQDHSVSTLIPYVAEFMPDCAVVTALINKYTALPRLQALAGIIGTLCEDSPTLVLCSVDFSHYQTPQDCQALDEQTAGLISRGDLAAILQLDYRNLDSPDCVAVAILVAKSRGLEAVLLDSRTDSYAEGGKLLAGSFMAWGFCPGE